MVFSMAAKSPQVHDAVVCAVTADLPMSAIVHELNYFTAKEPTPLCVILKGKGCLVSDFKTDLITALPSIKSERLIVTDADLQMLVKDAFALKVILDSNRVGSFVVLTTAENLERLLVVISVIFTTAYHIKVKVYGGDSYIDIPAVLTSVGQDFKSTLRIECSDYLASNADAVQETVEVVKSNSICDEVFVHGFSTRKGGSSTYPSVASLNLSFNPDKKDSSIVVEENRRRLLSAIGTPDHNFLLAKAIHSNTVWIVGSREPGGYDAIVCAQRGIVIAAPAADCVTLVLGDSTKSVCAAVHSGWKGTLANIIGATIETMSSQFGCRVQDIKAAIGPSIGVCCYEVGEDVEKLFSDLPLLKPCVESVHGKTKKHLNLQKALRLQLEVAGVSCDHIDDAPSKLCTFCNRERFYSYRRDGRPFGTHVGFIGLR